MSSDPSPDRPEQTEWACIHLSRTLAEVGPAVDRLRAWLKARGAASDQALEEILIATMEALTNAIRHGGGGEPDFTVRLAWSWRNGELEIEVAEPGLFEPAADWSQLPADSLAEGGRGGFLITELMDAVEHRNRGGRHSLRMRRRPASIGNDNSDTLAPGASSAALAETEAALAAMTDELGNAYETIAALFGLAEGLATTPELRALAGKSLARLRPLLGADAAWVRLAEEGGSLALLSSDGPAPGPAALTANSEAAEAEVARAGVERTLERRSTLAAADPLRAPAGSAFVCPFSFEGRLRGVLAVTRDADAGGFFTAGQTGLARTLADFLGIACANADLQRQRQDRLRAQRELEIAAQIQRALLPSSIAPHPAWNVAGVCAQAAEVGGDFYDVIDLPEGARLLVIADVMGKGVPAALVATTLRTAARSLANDAAGPGELLTGINRQLCDDLNRLGMFITVQILKLDAAGRSAVYASAAHCPPLVLDGAGAADWWDEAGGLPVGIDAREVYPEARRALEPGSRLWLMTDGALEHENPQGEELGTGGFSALAVRADAPPALLAALQARAGGRAARDDCTLVCVTPTGGLSKP